jgi:hypothetical protein
MITKQQKTVKKKQYTPKYEESNDHHGRHLKRNRNRPEARPQNQRLLRHQIR